MRVKQNRFLIDSYAYCELVGHSYAPHHFLSLTRHGDKLLSQFLLLLLCLSSSPCRGISLCGVCRWTCRARTASAAAEPK